MQLSLTVPDRVQLLTISREIEGNITTLKEIRVFQDLIGFSDDECQRLGFRQEGERVFWDGSTDELEVEVSVTVHSVIATLLKRLSSENKLRAEHLSLYEKFCE